MVTMTVFVNRYGFCRILNTLNQSEMHTEETDSKIAVSLAPNETDRYEIQVPIQTIGQVFEDKSFVNLYDLQELQKQIKLSQV